MKSIKQVFSDPRIDPNTRQILAVAYLYELEQVKRYTDLGREMPSLKPTMLARARHHAQEALRTVAALRDELARKDSFAVTH